MFVSSREQSCKGKLVGALISNDQRFPIVSSDCHLHKDKAKSSVPANVFQTGIDESSLRTNFTEEQH